MSINTTSDHRGVVVSAPGKVLLAGGYLVLDRKYQGLVFGLDARIHVHVRAGTLTDGLEDGFVVVKSPQFMDARWRYKCEQEKEGEWVKCVQMDGFNSSAKSRNPFVETTLTYALTYLSHLKINISSPLQITILADNDYYSQSTSSPPPTPTLSSASSKKASRFAKFPTTLPDTHKTGLGSSAALVTALTSALLSFFLDLSTPAALSAYSSRLHNLAQAAHCAAQGKVGSGFDVAAAIHGSILYRRFSPAILQSVGEPPSTGFGERLHRCVDDLDNDLTKRWDTEIGTQAAVQVPQRLRLVMCDVDCGSHSPSMVKTVLRWREQNPAEAEVLWGALQRGTEDLCRQLTALTKEEKEAVIAPSETTDYQGLRDTLLTIRSLVREMSAKSGTPIEPDVQTKLIDDCMEVEGVVGGVVPGAGGFDAVALLVRNDEGVMRRLAEKLRGWKVPIVAINGGGENGEARRGSYGDARRGSATIGRVKLLGVKQETEGVRVEDEGGYGEWVH